ncbi:MAG: hypothetical protein Kow0010_23040 [Dehalococcoidia bacterium]
MTAAPILEKAFPDTIEPTPASPWGANPMVAAAQMLRAAARLPYDASRPDRWRRSFQQLVGDAAQAVGMYRVPLRQPATAINFDRADWRRFDRAAARRCKEHLAIAERVRRLNRRAEQEAIEIHNAVDMMEEALALERAVFRCYQKYVDLVYESYNSEIGGLG